MFRFRCGFVVALLLCLGIASCGSVSPDVSAPLPDDDPLANLGWLAGHWQQVGSEGALDEELWLPPRGGAMLGMTRTVGGGSMKMFEFLRIESRREGVVLVAHPRAAAGGEFRMTSSDARSVTFENPEHDYPKRIEYRLDPSGTLRAQIFGDEPGPRWDYQAVGPVR